MDKIVRPLMIMVAAVIMVICAGCRKIEDSQAKLSNGKLLVYSIDLRSNLDARPVARQMLYSLLKYMESENFNPKEAPDIELIRNLLKQ